MSSAGDKLVFIWHDSAGNIIGVGTPDSGMAHRVEPIASYGQGFLRAAVHERELTGLRQTHHVDVRTGTLERRADSAT